MREIKFRGLTTKGEFVYGWLVQNIKPVGERMIAGTMEIHQPYGDWNKEFEVYDDTVGQLTGAMLHERELYDGDIIKFDWVYQDGCEPYSSDSVGILGVIKQCGCGFAVSMFCGALNWNLDELNQATFERHWCEKYFHGTDYFKMVNFEVIGNIHQNPELLERTNANHN